MHTFASTSSLHNLFSSRLRRPAICFTGFCNKFGQRVYHAAGQARARYRRMQRGYIGQRNSRLKKLSHSLYAHKLSVRTIALCLSSTLLSLLQLFVYNTIFCLFCDHFNTKKRQKKEPAQFARALHRVQFIRICLCCSLHT